MYYTQLGHGKILVQTNDRLSRRGSFKRFLKPRNIWPLAALVVTGYSCIARSQTEGSHDVIELLPERNGTLGFCIQRHIASWHVKQTEEDKEEYLGLWTDTYDLDQAFGKQVFKFEQEFDSPEGENLGHHISFYNYPSLTPIEVHERRGAGADGIVHVIHEGKKVAGFVKRPGRSTIILEEALERAVFSSALPFHAYPMWKGPIISHTSVWRYLCHCYRRHLG